MSSISARIKKLETRNPDNDDYSAWLHNLTDAELDNASARIDVLTELSLTLDKTDQKNQLIIARLNEEWHPPVHQQKYSHLPDSELLAELASLKERNTFIIPDAKKAELEGLKAKWRAYYLSEAQLVCDA